MGVSSTSMALCATDPTTEDNYHATMSMGNSRHGCVYGCSIITRELGSILTSTIPLDAISGISV